jgi:soluble lytic murein transglycosylase-like protein
MLVLGLAISAAALLLVRRFRAASQGHAASQAAASSTAELQPTAAPAGLSRKRKGFDAAIAELKSASTQNQHLAAYYNRVVKRTDGQAAEVEAATSVQTPVPRPKPEPPTLPAILPAIPALPALPAIPIVTAPSLGTDSPVPSLARAPGTGSAAAGQPAGRDQKPETVVPPIAEDLNSADAASSSAARSGFVTGDMKFDLNPAIDQWVRYYTQTPAGRSTMQQGLDRCRAYLDTSRSEFKQYGLPEDLVWVAQVESVWKQGAKSPVAAGGIWQFMPSTASDYGLAVGSPEDERFDPSKETRAAATYLHDLYTLFGSWELALAAYNCGEPRLMNAIVQCGQPDFWALYDRRLLPKETSNYVPKILAAIKVASDPGNYSFATEARSN